MSAFNEKVGHCPKCKRIPLVSKTRYGDRYSCCGLWSWGDTPLAPAETHRARNAAHAAFDPLWKSKRLRRSRAYHLLAEAMNLTPQECHMTLMDTETAMRVPAAVAKILEEFDQHRFGDAAHVSSTGNMAVVLTTTGNLAKL